MQKFLCILQLSAITTSLCTQNCLRCSSGQKCLLCNFQNKYYLQNETCQPSQVSNCKYFNYQGDCLLCIEGYFLSQTGTCLQVSLSSQIENCSSYDNKESCIFCSNKYFLQNNKCVKIYLDIPYCNSYQSQTKCLECEDNYYLTITFTCEQIPKINNCLFYTQKKCLECEEGYYKDENHYFDELFNLQNQSGTFNIQSFSSLTLAQKRGYYDPQTCVKIQIPNCVKYSERNVCQTCKDGYYLTDENSCEEIPLEPIQNCEQYESLQICQKCQQGYFKKNNLTCIQIISEKFIANCQLYDGTKDIPFCKICIKNYYVQNGTCKDRISKEIEKCMEMKIDGEGCIQCASNFEPNQDLTQCIKMIPNCLQYEVRDQQNQVFQCSKCSEGYFLDESFKCQIGKIQNCSILVNNGSKCTQCLNKFYLKDEKCLEHKEITNCKIYDSFQPDICTKCTNNFVSMKIQSLCVNMKEILNCKIYKPTVAFTTECQQCEDGYFLNKDKICQQVSIPNCAQQFFGNIFSCTKCMQGFAFGDEVLDQTTDKKCVLPLDYVTENCDTFQDFQQVDLFDIQCHICKSGAVPRKVSNIQICIKKSYFIYFFKKSNIPDNCLVTDHESCQVCKQGFYLTQNDLGTNCQECLLNSRQIYSIVLNCDDQTQICTYQLKNSCSKKLEPRGAIAGHSEDYYTFNQQITLSCQPGFITEVQFNPYVSYSSVNPENINKEFWIDHYLDFRPVVQCPLFNPNMKLNGVIQAQQPDFSDHFCRFWEQTRKNTNPGQYSCVSCFWGKAKSRNSTAKFIDSCEDITNCDINTKYYNLSANWTQYLTCHKCTGTDQVVFLAWFSGFKDWPNILDIPRFSTSNYNWTGATENFQTHIFCAEANTSQQLRASLSLPVTLEETKIKLVANCGLYYLNLLYSNSFDSSEIDFSNQNASFPYTYKQAIICGFCKPGHLATHYYVFVIIPPYFVTKCTPIPNCIGFQWVNACSKCAPGFAYWYGTDEFNNTAVFWNRCVPIDETLYNCFVFNDINAKCLICEKGYTLTEEYHCEKQYVPHCTNGEMNNIPVQAWQKMNLALGLYLTERGNGCKICPEDENLVLINENITNEMCLKIDFQHHENLLISRVRNCNKYFNETLGDNSLGYNYICAECKTGYILRVDGKLCVIQESLPNCLMASNDETQCKQCKENHYLNIDRKCVSINIINCQDYFTEIPQTNQLCKQCKNLFYWNGTTCEQGKVQHCLKYSGEKMCDLCEEGYWLIKNEHFVEDSDLCVSEVANLNCKQFQITEIQNSTIFNCSQCNNQWGQIYNIPLDQNLMECMDITKIENCADYIVTENNNYQCTKCRSGYYFINQVCIKRQIILHNCLELSENSEECKKCDALHFYDPVVQDCQSYPTGIAFCEIYLNLNTCKFCKKGLFLENGNCKKLEDSELIEFCYFYSSKKICARCNQNYILIDNQCKEKKLANCQITEDAENCQKCETNYVIDKSTSKKLCINFSRENCLEVSQIGNYECLTCYRGFYPNAQGDCSIALNILNCEAYLDEQRCRTCAKGFVLSSQKTSCLNEQKIDHFCAIMENVQQLQCSVCEAGYFLKDGFCVKFEHFGDNCLGRSFENETCIFCHPLYYMNEKGLCLSTVQQILQSTQSEVLLRCFLLLVFLFFI